MAYFASVGLAPAPSADKNPADLLLSLASIDSPNAAGDDQPSPFSVGVTVATARAGDDLSARGNGRGDRSGGSDAVIAAVAADADLVTVVAAGANGSGSDESDGVDGAVGGGGGGGGSVVLDLRVGHVGNAVDAITPTASTTATIAASTTPFGDGFGDGSGIADHSAGSVITTLAAPAPVPARYTAINFDTSRPPATGAELERAFMGSSEAAEAREEARREAQRGCGEGAGRRQRGSGGGGGGGRDRRRSWLWLSMVLTQREVGPLVVCMILVCEWLVCFVVVYPRRLFCLGWRNWWLHRWLLLLFFRGEGEGEWARVFSEE